MYTIGTGTSWTIRAVCRPSKLICGANLWLGREREWKMSFSWLWTDPRVKDWALMSSPFPTLAVCISYAYINKVIAPRLMANRKPFDLRNVLVAYNLFQTLFSAWIFYEVSAGAVIAVVRSFDNAFFSFAVSDERMVGPLQFQMPTCRLLK